MGPSLHDGGILHDFGVARPDEHEFDQCAAREGHAAENAGDEHGVEHGDIAITEHPYPGADGHAEDTGPVVAPGRGHAEAHGPCVDWMAQQHGKEEEAGEPAEGHVKKERGPRTKASESNEVGREPGQRAHECADVFWVEEDDVGPVDELVGEDGGLTDTPLGGGACDEFGADLVVQEGAGDVGAPAESIDEALQETAHKRARDHEERQQAQEV